MVVSFLEDPARLSNRTNAFAHRAETCGHQRPIVGKIIKNPLDIQEQGSL